MDPLKRYKTHYAKEYATAIEIRNFEIDLLWKRTGYYWAFITATFVAYGALNRQDQPDSFATLVVAHFGFITTVGWYLFIKGSKYWQKFWEQKLADLEYEGGLFVRNVDETKFGFNLIGFGPAKFSVSRIIMWYSAVTSLLWFALVVHEWGKFIGVARTPIPRLYQAITVSTIALLSLAALRLTHSGPRVTSDNYLRGTPPSDDEDSCIEPQSPRQ